jgi:hypothetical protein
MPVLQQEREILAIGEEHGWPFQALGIAPVPEKPVYHNNWWLVPVAEDHSQIPARALNRVQAIYAAGIRPKAFVIAHEALPQLMPPPDAPRVSRLEAWASRLSRNSTTILNITGKIAVAMIVPLAVAAVAATALAFVGLGYAIIADPCLIAITDENVWIQIDYWMA